MRTPVGSVWPESGTRMETVQVPPSQGEPLKSALLTNVCWHQLKFIPRLSGCGAGGCRQFISPVWPAVIHSSDIIGRLEPTLLPQLILLTNVEEGFCPPLLTSICTRCSSPHPTGYPSVSPSLSPSAGGWQHSLWVARPGDACYSVVCFGLDQNMARSVRPWTLFGQHPTANMNVLNCWKDIGTTNTPQSRWIWHVSHCSALRRISVGWRTLVSPCSNVNGSTTAASFKEILPEAHWRPQPCRGLKLHPPDEAALMTPTEWCFRRCRHSTGTRLATNFMGFLLFCNPTTFSS